MTEIWVFSLNHQVVSAHNKKKVAQDQVDRHCERMNLRKRQRYVMNEAECWDLSGDIVPLTARVTPVQLT